MNVTLNQPASQNFITQIGVTFWTRRLPTTNFTCQRANVPGMFLPSVDTPSPLVKVPYTGDQPDFETLKITFIVTEDFQNYFEILQWLREIGFPETTDEYAVVAKQPEWTGMGPAAPAVLTVLDNKKNPIMAVTFNHCFPIGLSGLQLDITNDNIQYLTADAEFRFLDFDVLETQNANTLI